MNHHFTFTLGMGGMGFMGRVIIALAIILILKSFDKNNDEYSKGMKMLFAGTALAVVFSFLAMGIFRGLFFLPSALFFY